MREDAEDEYGFEGDWRTEAFDYPEWTILGPSWCMEVDLCGKIKR